MSYLRHPKTQQEHAAFFALQDLNEELKDEHIVIKIRLSRSHRNLPTAYDDIPPSHYRTWKKHRTTQFH